MELHIALAGNPNSGKTTLFNALTGANQYVGNWPGVTVEKKEGRLKKSKEVIVTDLPGIYSLSPYTLEEVVARNFLTEERVDAIINIVDGTNLERNLYLTTQLLELGIPMVVAINMMDIVKKSKDVLDIQKLSQQLGCPVVTISALKSEGIDDLISQTIEVAQKKGKVASHLFSGPVEHALAHIEEAVIHDMPLEQQRWYAIKVFERDEKVIEKLSISESMKEHIEKDIIAAENEMDDDSESIITNERYILVGNILKTCYKKDQSRTLTHSDKIDTIITNRFFGLPIFVLIMYLVYSIAMTGFGKSATDWANDGLFSDGYHLFGKGTAEYEEVNEEYTSAFRAIDAFIDLDTEAEDFDAKKALEDLKAYQSKESVVTYAVEDEDTLAQENIDVYFDKVPSDAGDDANAMSYKQGVEYFEKNGFDAPDQADYGTWVPGVPVVVGSFLSKIGVADWLQSLILDGIVAGVGAVLGFVPQMFVLFFLLAILEDCGYMARIAFVLDRIFRKFGLSGKSFIPMLVASGCGVPGIMASRTIENEKDRRMTICTTTFVPCGAKLPFIAMIAGALFGNSSWVATSAYFMGFAAVIVSGIILKKTKMFAGDPAAFVMELPAYHIPSVRNVLHSTWERGWSFIKKAGTIILVSTIFVWFTTFFGWVDGNFQMLAEDQLDYSIMAKIGNMIAWIFIPLGWGNWQAAVASFTGLVAKENIVGTMGILYGSTNASVYQTLHQVFSSVSGYSFLAFNLLCAPCFAAIGAIKREMNSTKWTSFAIVYQCALAYVVAFMVYQIGGFFTHESTILGLVSGLIVLGISLYKKKKKNPNTIKEGE